MLKALLIAAAIVTPVAGAAYYDHTAPVTVEYITDSTWAGDPIITKRTTSALGNKSWERVGFFGGGNPGVIGLGCEGAEQPIIAMEESDLPVCREVHPIANRKNYLPTA